MGRAVPGTPAGPEVIVAVVTDDIGLSTAVEAVDVTVALPGGELLEVSGRETVVSGSILVLVVISGATLVLVVTGTGVVEITTVELLVVTAGSAEPGVVDNPHFVPATVSVAP